MKIRKFQFFILIFYSYLFLFISCLKDRLLQACYISDLKQVEYLLKEYNSGIIQTGVVPIVINRIEKNYKRTSLLQCGFDPQSNNITEIDYNCSKIAYLLSLNGANLSHVDKYGWNGIAIGSTTGMIKYTEFLINNNVSINLCDNNGRTPLMKAITHGHIEIVKLLLNHGANISITDNYGWSIYHFIITQLKNNYDLYYPILQTILNATITTTTTTITTTQNNSIINYQDKDGRTPLFYAVIHKLKDIVDLLLKHGSDPRIIDNHNLTVLQITTDESIKSLLLQGLVNITIHEHQQYIQNIQKKMKKLNEIEIEQNVDDEHIDL